MTTSRFVALLREVSALVGACALACAACGGGGGGGGGGSGSFSFSTTSFAVSESAGTVAVTVQRNGGSTGAASVRYATSDGTATAGSDYTPVSGTLSFAAGETSKTFTVAVAADAVTEGSETINVTLSAAVGASLGSPNPAVITISDPPGAPPAPPSTLTATPGDGRVELAWSASSQAATYRLKRGTASGGPYQTINTGATGTSLADSTVTNGMTYYYVVTAVNDSGESAPSPEASATPSAGAGAPAAPTGLTATPGNRRVTLLWTASAGATSYNVSRQQNSPFSMIATGVTATTYVDTTVSNGLPHHYTVQAVNAFGSSPPSAAVTATPSGCEVLASSLSFQYLGSVSTGNSLAAIVIDADRVYWFDYDASLGATGGAIRSVPKAGGSVAVVASGLGGVGSLAVDANNVYWTEFVPGPLDGVVKQVAKAGGVTPTSLTSVFFPTGLAVDATHVYFSSGPGSALTTRRIPIGGGTATPVSEGAGAFYAASLALDADFVYGVDLTGSGIPTGRARRVPKAGGTVEVLATGLENAFGLALSGSALYWAEINSAGKIGTAPKTGGGATYLATNIRDPHNAALDASFVYFDRGAPVNGELAVAKVPLGGGTMVAATEPGCSGLFVAVDATHIYMSVFGNAVAGAGKIQRTQK